MGLHSPMAKRLWNVLRITFFMIRKGLISKRKMIMDINLMMKKGKVLRKSLSNLIHLNHNHSKSIMGRGRFGVQDYEFSCSNSPNPVFLQIPKRKHHFNFPCIHSHEVYEEEPHLSALEEVESVEPMTLVLVPKTPEYAFNFRFDASDFGHGEKKSPLLSPFSVRISNYSALDENEEIVNGQVDDQAEDFIKRFYEQLRKQSPKQLL
ncbi:hypothetical protein TanjilG_07823 [Lupinus angustifolius]|uniref:Uncharacterized protein n=1 Tax=Lupinus angustifolius TaxID=3871 RepID=A0A1J7H9H3_LUPAN|nr:PREDICTED: uncharacterized protein LOC109350633 [Lupinus angustifolius]OIW09438.1 hypothetical protein TanjilG_07823 [Lupinus angustifolius]